MADFSHTLKAIYDPRKAPFAFFTDTLTGVQTIEYIAGELFGVPNVWELVTLRMTLVTSADVDNRIITVKLLPDGTYVCEQAAGDAIAASTTINTFITKMGFEAETAGSRFLGISDKAWNIYGDGKITIDITDGHAGDAFTVRAHFRWLNYEIGMYPPFGMKFRERL